MNRFHFITLITSILGAYFLLILNIYNLQIQKGQYYSEKAQLQYRLSGFLEPHRGLIYFSDKNNNLIPAAINKSYETIFAVPREINDIDKTVENLGPILNIEQEQLRKQIGKKNLYEPLVKKATPEQISKINESPIKGIYVDDQEWRYYPFGNLASQVLGFVGYNDQNNFVSGQYGIEKKFDGLLSGKPGMVENKEIIKPIQGSDLATTIDRNIQTEVETKLKDLIEKHKAAGGTVIIQEPKTGKIIALANYPTFDPNNYSQYNIAHFINPAVQSIYEPGSVFKVITVAAGLDSKKITPETTYYDSGSISFPDGKKIKNWDLKAHGTVTVREIIERSINTGSAFMESKIGHKNFYDYVNKFGFEDLTQIDLPGEVSGNLKNIKTKNSNIDFATASFGQGISVTPIQLISAVSAIANKGKLMRPYITATQKPLEIKQVISPEAANETTDIMVSTVNKALVAKIPKYKIAGKTGTAQVPDFKRGGYTTDVINSYAGFAPASDPKFVILIKLDKPEGAPLAGATVVPLFRELTEFILNYYNIPPDDIIS